MQTKAFLYLPVKRRYNNKGNNEIGNNKRNDGFAQDFDDGSSLPDASAYRVRGTNGRGEDAGRRKGNYQYGGRTGS